jgi:hypothetical protein
MRRTALVLVAGLAVACAPTPAAAPSSSSPSSSSPALPSVPGMVGEVVLLRTDEAIGGQVQVRVTDTGDTPFTVTSVALASPGFSPLPAEELRAEFVPGRVIDLPTPYGAPDCSAEPLPAAAALSVVRPHGTEEELRVPLDAEVLARIHGEQCAALAVLEVVAIELTGLREEAEALTGELTLTRREGDDPVTLTRLDRSVLIDPVVEDLPLELSDEESVSAPVTFTPATCDPHVLSETKKPYVFPVTVRVGDGDDVSLDLPIDETARGLLAALVQRVCTPTG